MELEELLLEFGTSFQIFEGSKAIGAGLATIALAGVGAGIGIVFNGYLIAYATNPSLKNELFRIAILGFALAEACGLFCLMISFLLLYAV